jgi:hypothetical protein
VGVVLPCRLQHLAVQQYVERLGQLAPDAVFLDVEVGEERLVEQPS